MPDGVVTAGEDAQATRGTTFRLSGKALTELEWIAERSGVSLGEAMARAIGIQRYILEKSAEGAEILVEQKDGRTKRILVP